MLRLQMEAAGVTTEMKDGPEEDGTPQAKIPDALERPSAELICLALRRGRIMQSAHKGVATVPKEAP
ncbi:hypothetical protein [Caulobacter sp. S45]|uniref:hypothetical protein n=1 Tax=Caulobacter sp. S45 TaxID=1641861 RepID=UPI00131C5261|nr:hypothetical protein [Caulobacter sp. S45]